MDQQPEQNATQQEQLLQRVALLHGHVDADTAYLVEDYPYGWELRCRIRFWVGTAARGAKRGQQRFVAQTTNPRRPGHPWNSPKQGSYTVRHWMYLDTAGHVQHTGISPYGIEPHRDAWIRLIGIYEQLTDTDRAIYEQVLQISRRYAQPWNRWQDTIGFLAEQLATHGQPPPVQDGTVLRDGQRFYIGADAYPIAVAAARQRLAE